jgi:hypothetical protein
VRELHESEVRDAIIVTDGELAAAARRLGLPRWRLVRFMDEKPALPALVEDINQAWDEDAESEVAEAVFAGKLDAARFVLRTIGRRRGYGKPMTPDEEAHIPNLNGPLPPWNMPDRFNDEQEANLITRSRTARKSLSSPTLAPTWRRFSRRD